MPEHAAERSSGYEAVAQQFIRLREASAIGVGVIQHWAGLLPTRAVVLDLGCGAGVPVATTLAAAGLRLYGIDASAQLLQAYRQRLPHAIVACETVQDSGFFQRNFDAVIAIGLMFLLPAEQQAQLIDKVAARLNPGGRFLFTSPEQSCHWIDVLTGQASVSLGAAKYRSLGVDAGLQLVANYQDEGQNYYYDWIRL
jgi:2-polyprenyl-3-methyl-5-hydroxy-6-metoxy-1,4-benzoquinol methylase